MKNIKLIPLLFIVLAAVTSCRKNYYGNGSYYGNGNQAGNSASTVGSTLASNADGIVNLVGNATLSAQNMINANSSCGTIKSDSTTQQSATGATTTYKYINKDKLVVLCNSTNQPDSALNNSSYAGSYSNTGVTSSNSGSSAFNIGGVLVTATYYTVSGTYTRMGNYVYNNSTQIATTSNINITFNNLLVNKPYRNVVGGTATFTISSTDTNGGVAAANGNYSYTGTLTFSNTNYAALTLNGANYSVNLTTGAVTQM